MNTNPIPQLAPAMALVELLRENPSLPPIIWSIGETGTLRGTFVTDDDGRAVVAAYAEAVGAEVRLLDPVEQIRHLHACVTAQMSRADTLNRLCREQRERANAAKARVAELEAQAKTTRTEAIAEAKTAVFAWLSKKGREERTWDAWVLASKVDRGAIRLFLNAERGSAPAQELRETGGAS